MNIYSYLDLFHLPTLMHNSSIR